MAISDFKNRDKKKDTQFRAAAGIKVALSEGKSAQNPKWNEIVHIFHKGGLVTGKVKSVVKGGLMLDIGVEAFLPGSQVDIIAPQNLRIYEGRTLECKIVTLNEERRNVVLSRRDLLEVGRAEKRLKLLGSIEKGRTVRGPVRTITDFGAFIDLGGLDGLLHISDMSWSPLKHPSEMLKVGQEINVLVLDVDREKERVSLGLKQITEIEKGKTGASDKVSPKIEPIRLKVGWVDEKKELLIAKEAMRVEASLAKPPTIKIHDFLPLEGGRLDLRFHQKPEVVFGPANDEFEIAGWDIKLPLSQAKDLNRIMARKFMILATKADSGDLSEAEQWTWLAILDQVDYTSYCIRRAAPHYLEGEVQSLTPQFVVEWSDGRTEILDKAVAASFSELQVGDTFGAYVKLGAENKALSAERVAILAAM